MRAIKGIVGSLFFICFLLIFCSIYSQTEDQKEPSIAESLELKSDDEQVQADDTTVTEEDEESPKTETADESPAEQVEEESSEESKEEVTEPAETEAPSEDADAAEESKPEDEEGPKKVPDEEPAVEEEKPTEDEGEEPEADDAKVVKESEEAEPSEVEEKAEEPEKEEAEEAKKPAEEKEEVEKPAEEEEPKTLEEAVPPSPEPVTSEDFDTITLKEYGGNWFFKRGWWERAEEEYEKVRQALDQVFEARVDLIQIRQELDRNTFDVFYEDMGVARGSLEDLLDDLTEQVEGERPLNLKEQEFYDLLQSEKKSIEQIRLEVDCIAKHEDALENVIGMVTRQINAARQYEQLAWQEFKSIADDLNDVKARERYFTIKTMYKNIKNVNEYLRGSLRQYFDEIEQLAKKEIERAKAMQDSLRSKGIDLKKEAKKLFGDEDEEEAEEEKPVVPEPAETEGEETPEELDFFGNLWATITGGIKAIWNFLFGWIYRF